ncbi:MAG: helix-turn-helix transcriptional regulator [Clostridia bacterium]
MDYRYMGEQIRKHRREQGRTQAWLAESADVSTSFIGHVERGTRKASLETLGKICVALSCTMDVIAMPPHGNKLMNGYSQDELAQSMRLLEAALAMSRR